MVKLLQIELNEFNLELLTDYSERYGYKGISSFLTLRKTQIYTDERTEHRDLDPWVQWVSLHTGKPLNIHKISYLGEAPDTLSCKQTWDTLASRGVSTGIWGAMNTRFRDHRCLKFFLPDPWCWRENCKPEILNSFIGLAACYAKGYGSISIKDFGVSAVRFIVFFLRHGFVRILFRNISYFFSAFRYVRSLNIVLFALFDLISSELFIIFYKRHSPDYGVIFLNCVAHLQHHNWQERPGNNINRFVIRVVDTVLTRLIDAAGKDSALILTNGFGQVYESEDYYCYRQVNFDKFLVDSRLTCVSYLRGMTDDVLVTFGSVGESRDFVDLILSTTIDGERIFSVGHSGANPRIVSFRVSLKSHVPQGSRFEINGKSLFFYDYFKVIANRTGSHVPDGLIFSSGITMPDRARNDKVHPFILRHFGCVD